MKHISTKTATLTGKLCFLLAVVCARTTVRTRLRDPEGVVVEPATGTGNHENTKSSMWLLEGNSTMGYVKLKFNHFDLECAWDYLHIYSGDSVHGDKLAAYTGDLLPVTSNPNLGRPTAIPVSDTTSSFSGVSGSGSGGMIESVLPTQEILISSSSPNLLLHFYSDLAATRRGFNISYWISSCIANCSGNGDCNEDDGSCNCHSGWTGEYCQYEACPAACSGRGQCDQQLQLCACNSGFTGKDCSLSEDVTHWKEVDVVTSLGTDQLERAGHTAVVWDQWMWVYGGYQFPRDSSNMSLDGSAVDESVTAAQLIRYHFETETWELIPEQEDSEWPHPRYGHSAVIYNDTMIVFGGSLLPSERISNELWEFNFSTLTWTQLSTESNLTENSTTTHTSFLPIGVRDHTANVVGNKMVVLFGYSELSDILLRYVQEYDFVNQSWSAPPQYTVYRSFPDYRMGHTSCYVPDTGLIYVHGGVSTQGKLSDLLAYHPQTHVWSRWSSGPTPQAFHSMATLGTLFVTFGGTMSGMCFGNKTAVYNIMCDSWQLVDIPGLPLNSSRTGHSAVAVPSGVSGAGSMIVFGGFLGQLHHDTLLLSTGNCSKLSVDDCTSDTSVMCGWSNSSSQCLSLTSSYQDTALCAVPDPCRLLYTCSSCLNSVLSCVWNASSSRCVSTTRPGTNSSIVISNSSICNYPLIMTLKMSCSRFSSCVSCAVHEECVWNTNTSHCVATAVISNNGLVPPGQCPAAVGCSQHTTCAQCSSSDSCLWCPSLNMCVTSNSNLYPYTFPFGQCLGWVSDRYISQLPCFAETCSAYKTCSSCEEDVRCGWCKYPADTGLGFCGEGGFLAARNLSTCPSSRWYFDECPACQCNGHSTCVNKSVCFNCQNNTTGEHCEQCVDTFYGDPTNGNFCTACDCNGYNSTCNRTNGNCVCGDAGVTGPRCTQCNGPKNFIGDASNICYFPLSVGFIYSQLNTGARPQAFYMARPSGTSTLYFKIELYYNPEFKPVWVQLYLARVSERFHVLLNLTEPRLLNGTDSFDMYIGSFSTPNDTELFSFAHNDITSTANFTELFSNAVGNDYSESLWDGDVALLIRVFNVSSSAVFRITVDQSNFMFIVYFFITFVSCFTFLLSAFMIGWYIKRKLEIRAYIRAQHIEMQRRVRRPFARIKANVDKCLEPGSRQEASYVAVETCKDSKAAVLTLLVRLPGNSETGRPSSGRTGVCFGSTLVKMNTSKVKNRKHKESSVSNTQRREHTQELTVNT